MIRDADTSTTAGAASDPAAAAQLAPTARIPTPTPTAGSASTIAVVLETNLVIGDAPHRWECHVAFTLHKFPPVQPEE